MDVYKQVLSLCLDSEKSDQIDLGIGAWRKRPAARLAPSLGLQSLNAVALKNARFSKLGSNGTATIRWSLGLRARRFELARGHRFRRSDHSSKNVAAAQAGAKPQASAGLVSSAWLPFGPGLTVRLFYPLCPFWLLPIEIGQALRFD